MADLMAGEVATRRLEAMVGDMIRLWQSYSRACEPVVISAKKANAQPFSCKHCKLRPVPQATLCPSLPKARK